MHVKSIDGPHRDRNRGLCCCYAVAIAWELAVGSLPRLPGGETLMMSQEMKATEGNSLVGGGVGSAHSAWTRSEG